LKPNQENESLKKKVAEAILWNFDGARSRGAHLLFRLSCRAWENQWMSTDLWLFAD
jgi:hypothetical protein